MVVKNTICIFDTSNNNNRTMENLKKLYNECVNNGISCKVTNVAIIGNYQMIVNEDLVMGSEYETEYRYQFKSIDDVITYYNQKYK